MCGGSPPNRPGDLGYKDQHSGIEGSEALSIYRENGKREEVSGEDGTRRGWVLSA
jgi:hypothetical protein